MDKYLLEILKDVNTIIIPGLGALTITNADKGEIMFMSYLKHDDGKLTSYIAEKEGMDENEAKNLVAKYVREIHVELDKGESYDMYKFGSFYKNDGEPDFKSWTAMHPTEEKQAVTPVIEEQVEDDNILIPSPPLNEKTEEEEEEEEEEIPAIVLPEEKEIDVVTPEVIKEEQINKKEAVILDNSFVASGSEKKELNILEKEEKEATAAKLEKLRTEQEDQKKKKKRGAGFYVVLTIVVLLIGGSTFFGLNYDQYKQHIPFLADNSPKEEDSQLEQMEELLIGDNEADNEMLEETVTEIIESEEIPTDIEESTIEEKESEIPQESIEVPSNNSNIDLPFHVIAGAFSSEANAIRLGDKLREAGHQVKVGKGRGMNLVSVKSFATRVEAQSGLSSLKDVAPNGWIYEWK